MQKGQNLIEFAIIWSLIAVIAIAGLSMIGENVNKLFLKSEKEIAGFKPFGSVPIDTSTATKAPGYLGGKVGEAIKNCNATTCDIDFGDYVLTGIPNDFESFVTSSGTSGSNESILKLAEQIADQLALQGDTSGAKDFRDMANLGHFMVAIEKQVEERATICKLDADPTGCLKSKIFDTNTVTVPSEIKTLIPKFKESNTLYEQGIFNIGMGVKVGSYYGHGPSNCPAYKIAEIYKNVKNNSSYSPTVRGIADELIYSLHMLSNNNSRVLEKLQSGGSAYHKTGTNYDPVTETSIAIQSPKTDPESVLHPQTSMKNNLTSVLICATGKNKSSSTKCH